jgi:transaldolase
MANRVIEVRKYGQSIWYDNIRRSLITSGDLTRMVNEEGLLGVTSNPAIFTAAITGSPDYDQPLKALVKQGVGKAEDIYEKMAIEDIQAACDVLAATYRRTNRIDGYVSFEVSPYLANDTAGTIKDAKRLHGLIARENVLIKIPATDAGYAAIQATITEGISVNVTLLFSVEQYVKVAEAYLAGLEAYAAKGGDISKVASVASFFISRIDTLLDDKIAFGGSPMLNTEKDPDKREKLKKLVGKVAIANAKIAYAKYKEICASDRWKALKAKGAMPQRLLWASTSTKNPKYPKTIYVDELIGAETVNTVPAETYIAFRDTGNVRPSVTENWDENISNARETMQLLADVGINFKEVASTLLKDAVSELTDHFDRLMTALRTDVLDKFGDRGVKGVEQHCVEKPVGAESEPRASGGVRRKGLIAFLAGRSDRLTDEGVGRELDSPDSPASIMLETIRVLAGKAFRQEMEDISETDPRVTEEPKQPLNDLGGDVRPRREDRAQSWPSQPSSSGGVSTTVGEGLLMRAFPRMVAFASQCLGDEQAAEDVVQAAIVRVLYQRDKLSPDTVELFVWHVLRWAIGDELRRRGTQPAQIPEQMTGLVAPDSPAEYEGDDGELLTTQRAIESQCREILCGAVGTMTDRERAALSAWLEADRDNTLALTLLRDSDPKVTADAFAMRIHHARKRLRLVRQQVERFLAEFPGLNVWSLLIEVIRDAHSRPEGGH